MSLSYTMTLARAKELIPVLFANDPVVKRGFFTTTRKGWRIPTNYKTGHYAQGNSQADILGRADAAEKAGCNTAMFVFKGDGKLMFAIAYNAMIRLRYGAGATNSAGAGYGKCPWHMLAFYPSDEYPNESHLWKWAGDYVKVEDHLKSAQQLKYSSEQLVEAFDTTWWQTPATRGRR